MSTKTQAIPGEDPEKVAARKLARLDQDLAEKREKDRADARTMAECAVEHYKTLKDGGVPEASALQWTENYLNQLGDERSTILASGIMEEMSS